MWERRFAISAEAPVACLLGERRDREALGQQFGFGKAERGD